MVKSQSQFVSSHEADLIDAIRQVQFGELYGVEIAAGGGDFIEMPLAPAMWDLILYIRSGVQHIDVLTVHHGQPIQAETDCKILGFRCRKKAKFPTIPTEG